MVNSKTTPTTFNLLALCLQTSDYINGSFMDGYKRGNAYIATQGEQLSAITLSLSDRITLSTFLKVLMWLDTFSLLRPFTKNVC